MALHVPKAQGFAQMLKDGARVRFFDFHIQVSDPSFTLCVIFYYFIAISFKKANFELTIII